jgi:hypothetical protein
LPSRRSLPPIAVVLSVHRRHDRAVPCRRGAVAPSIENEEPSRRPFPSRSRRAIHCCQGAIPPYLAIKEPSAVLTDDSGHLSLVTPLTGLSSGRLLPHLPAPLIAASPFVPLIRWAGCPVSSLLTPPPPICRCFRLSSRRRLLSRPTRASHLAG